MIIEYSIIYFISNKTQYKQNNSYVMILFLYMNSI